MRITDKMRLDFLTKIRFGKRIIWGRVERTYTGNFYAPRRMTVREAIDAAIRVAAKSARLGKTK